MPVLPLLCLLLAIVCPACTSEELAQDEMAILFGPDEHGYPYVVPLSVPGSVSFCTGTLVAPLLVLTAAHCVVEDGEVYRPDVFGETIPTDRIHIHPRYFDTENCLADYENDLALLELSQPQSGPVAQLAREIPSPSRTPDIPLKKVGFGYNQVAIHDHFCRVIDNDQSKSNDDACLIVYEERDAQVSVSFETGWSRTFPGKAAASDDPVCPDNCDESSYRAYRSLQKSSDWQKFLDDHCDGRFLTGQGYLQSRRAGRVKTSGGSVLSEIHGARLISYGDITSDGQHQALGSGDSGGPLFIMAGKRPQLIGVASTGQMVVREGRLRFKDSHVNIHDEKHRAWIAETLDRFDLSWPDFQSLYQPDLYVSRQ